MLYDHSILFQKIFGTWWITSQTRGIAIDFKLTIFLKLGSLQLILKDNTINFLVTSNTIRGIYLFIYFIDLHVTRRNFYIVASSRPRIFRSVALDLLQAVLQACNMSIDPSFLFGFLAQRHKFYEIYIKSTIRVQTGK